MSVSSTVRMQGELFFPPERLIGVTKRLPHINFYVPLLMFDVEFDGLVVPNIEDAGNRAVRMTLAAPFGFMRNIEGEVVRSQKTEELLLAPAVGSADSWDAVITTPEPLTEMDFNLFSFGTKLYAAAVEGRLREGGIGYNNPYPPRPGNV